METGSFEKQIVLTPDLCGRRAGLSPLAAFTIFQGIASEHAEAIGVGGAAMAKRGEFWLTVHSRVDFYEPAYLMDALTAQTWPERCEGRDIRCFRSYRLTHGEKTVALGRTQWAILGPEGKILRFEQSGFPADFPFRPGAAIDEPPTRFHDDLTQDELVYPHLVRATDIDMGRHMNNVVYIRLLLDCFSAKELASGMIRTIEAHYASPCLEGETLVLRADNAGIAVSAGSACSSGSLDPSHVLLAIGVPRQLAFGSLRLSFGALTSEDDVDLFIEKLPEVLR